MARQIPADPTGVQTITTPGNVTLRYKEPGKEGVCETTPGVNSYSGYIDVAPDAHLFFYFFEARHDPNNAPITLWRKCLKLSSVCRLITNSPLASQRWTRQ